MKIGRPTKDRNKIAGKNLRFALKVLGKTWRKNTEDPDHVTKWDRWNIYNLPKSTVTIDTDIKKGVPKDRILSYAKCFGLSTIDFGTKEIDMYDALGISHTIKKNADPFQSFWQYPSVWENYLEYNSSDNLDKLFELLAGVYRVYYALPGVRKIFRALFHIYEKNGFSICGKGFFVDMDEEKHFISNIFRWQRNLHATLYCLDDMILGYCLMQNPLQAGVPANARSMAFYAHGVTDSIQPGHTVITYDIRLEKIMQPGRIPFDSFWELESRTLRQRPVIRERDPEYAALYASLSSGKGGSHEPPKAWRAF